MARIPGLSFGPSSEAGGTESRATHLCYEPGVRLDAVAKHRGDRHAVTRHVGDRAGTPTPPDLPCRELAAACELGHGGSRHVELGRLSERSHGLALTARHHGCRAPSPRPRGQPATEGRRYRARLDKTAGIPHTTLIALAFVLVWPGEGCAQDRRQSSRYSERGQGLARPESLARAERWRRFLIAIVVVEERTVR